MSSVSQAPTSLKDRVPPHNVEAESAILGAIMLDSDALELIITYVRAEDFYKHSHATIFQAMCNLFGRSEEIDIITVTQELRSSDQLDKIGGAAYISALTAMVPTSANIEYYARIVSENSARRKLLRISQQIMADVFNEGRVSRIIIEEAERHIFEITNATRVIPLMTAKEVVREAVEVIEKRHHNHDEYTGIPTGFEGIDRMLDGLQNSEFIVIGARPSVGKTAFALNIAANISLRGKGDTQLGVGFFTLEMSHLALMQRLLSSEARIGSQTLRTGLLRSSDFKQLTDAAGHIYDAPFYIVDTPNMRLLDLRAIARRMVARYAVRIIFIDYLTLVTSENFEAPRYEQIAEISRSLKALARELNIPVVALSQLTRDSEGRRPNLANIRESGSIEQDADVVIFLHRERSPNQEGDEASNIIETDVIIAKQRNGPIGTVRLAFIPKFASFEALSEERP